MKNKNLLITGGATRIGKEIALHFSKKGWNIAIHYFKSSLKAKILSIKKSLVYQMKLGLDFKKNYPHPFYIEVYVVFQEINLTKQ